MKGYKVFYCWLCKQRRHFYAFYDEDGLNWEGSCDHWLWSQRQYDAEMAAKKP